MIRFLVEKGPHGCPCVFFGLSHENLERLRAGQPIHLDVDQCAALGLGQREVVIFSGDSEESMARELEGHGLVPEGTGDKTAAAMRGEGDTER